MAVLTLVPDCKPPGLPPPPPEALERILGYPVSEPEALAAFYTVKASQCYHDVRHEQAERP